MDENTSSDEDRGEDADDGSGEDESGEDERSPAEKAEQDDEPNEARLEEVGQHIESARGQADEAIMGFGDEEGEEGEEGEGDEDLDSREQYADSGSEEAEAEDDQTAAPPG